MNAVTQRMLDLPLDIPGTNHERVEAARFIERAILDAIEQGLASLAQREEARPRRLLQGDCCYAGARIDPPYGSKVTEKNLRRMM